MPREGLSKRLRMVLLCLRLGSIDLIRLETQTWKNLITKYLEYQLIFFKKDLFYFFFMCVCVYVEV